MDYKVCNLDRLTLKNKVKVNHDRTLDRCYLFDTWLRKRGARQRRQGIPQDASEIFALV
jgi:hypothetical protein